MSRSLRVWESKSRVTKSPESGVRGPKSREKETANGWMRSHNTLRQLSWMQPQDDPQFPQWHDDLVIHPQCSHCCTACRCCPKNTCAILTPDEMLLPLLAARIKQSDPASSMWVSRMGLLPLITIARTATQTEVGQISASSCSRWYDVIDFQRKTEEPLKTMAVGATRVSRLRTQGPAQRKRNGAYRASVHVARAF